MKKLALLLTIVMLLSSCGAAAGDSSAQGTTQAADSAGQNTEVTAQPTQENGTELTDSTGVKPELEIIGEEEEDFDRAVSTRSKKAAADPNAYMLRSSGNAAGNVAGDGAGSVTPSDNYTVMVYIVGSNLESRLGAATSDIEEMRDAAPDYDKVNLLLYTGGSRRWVSDIPNDTNNVLDLSMDEETRITAQTSRSANMGSPETLAEFINYCTRNYPAEHYALILWDHGGGPLWGYGSDELFGNDSLSLKELRDALDSTGFGPDRKLDWIGFDACLMGSIENAVLWKDYAEYLVSSEEVEAGKGWDYHFLSTLNEAQEPETVVRSIVDNYGRYYEENRSEFFNPDATLSAMDLSMTEELTGSVDALFEVMNKGIAEGDYAKINQARSRTKAFGLGAVNSIEEAYDLVDLKDFAGQLTELYPEESARVLEAVDRMVVHSTSNVEGAGGISIYLPGNNKALYNASEELYAEAAPISTAYESYVDAYTSEWFSESEIDWNLDTLRAENGELTLQLTEEQAENVSQAYYAVLWRNFTGEYVKALINLQIEADENGVLHIPEDPMLVTVRSDVGESDTPWTCRQVSAKGNEKTYSTVKTDICGACEFTDYMSTVNDHVEFVIGNREGERETEIKDIVSDSEGSWSSGKESVDVSAYTTVMDLATFGRSPERDENGRMKPFFTWENGGSYSSSPVPVDSSFRFIMKPASEFSMEFSCQVVLRDVYDGIHATELIDFPVSRKQEIVEVPTQNGVIQYEIFDDHAEVYQYNGTDKEVEIAGSISGKPVTAVADDAFSSNEEHWGDEENMVDSVILPDSVTEIGYSSLPYMKQVRLPKGLVKIGPYALTHYRSETIEIPDSVEIIGNSAFRWSDLTTVKLPASLQKIGAIPFDSCTDLEEITIDENNPHYRTVDGVLYTADLKTLIQYPHAKGIGYRIEDGTETIAYGAFADSIFYVENSSSMTLIEFPESLRTIENAAFYNCKGLQELTFPASLETIGKVAFGDAYYMSSKGTQIETVFIGPNVSRIEAEAFSALAVKAFEVDPGNEVYASAGGFITNKAGDTILTAPRGGGKTVVVPEGITTLPEAVFEHLDDAREFYIPDTVFRFAKDVFGDPDYSDLSGITIHCTEGSAAEAYAKKYGIPCETGGDNTPEEFCDETMEIDEVRMTFRIYDDHVAIVEAATSDVVSRWEVPSTYKELPVTAIIYEEELSSDDWLNVKEIVIPDSIRRIDADAFCENTYLESITVAENNESYHCEDGVLFSADNILICYPSKKSDEVYTVPDGTVEIGKSAFMYSNNLREISIPDSVTVIEEDAFYSNDTLSSVNMGQGVERIEYGAFRFCYNLSEVNLPDGLISIGDYAFKSTALKGVRLPLTVESIGDFAFTLNDDFGEIVLPDSLTYLGYSAFETDTYDGEVFLQDTLKIPAGLKFDQGTVGVLVKEFDVDESNPYHSVIDGLLMSKDGKTLLSVPGQKEGAFTIPDGVEIIKYMAFDECQYLKEVYVPDSVLDTGYLGEDSLYGPCSYTIYCHEGSEAEKQLKAMGIAYEVW